MGESASEHGPDDLDRVDLVIGDRVGGELHQIGSCPDQPASKVVVIPEVGAANSRVRCTEIGRLVHPAS